MSGDPPAAESLLFNENCFLECNNHIPETVTLCASSNVAVVQLWVLGSYLCAAEKHTGKVGRGNNPADFSHQRIQWGRKFRLSWGMQSEGFFCLSAGHRTAGRASLQGTQPSAGFSDKHQVFRIISPQEPDVFLPLWRAASREGRLAMLRCKLYKPEVCQSFWTSLWRFFIPMQRIWNLRLGDLRWILG